MAKKKLTAVSNTAAPAQSAALVGAMQNYNGTKTGSGTTNTLSGGGMYGPNNGGNSALLGQLQQYADANNAFNSAYGNALQGIGGANKTAGSSNGGSPYTMGNKTGYQIQGNNGGSPYTMGNKTGYQIQGNNGGTGAMGGAGSSYDALIQQMMGNAGQQTSLSDLQGQAADIYASKYGQQALEAKQAYDRSDLALANQMTALNRNYDKQREASQAQYDQTYSQADQNLLKRGMGRSSYGAQTLANIDMAGNKAQQDLWTAQGEDSNNLYAQRAQLAQQLGDQLKQYASSRTSDEAAWVTNQLNQQRQENTANNQWLASFLSGEKQNAIANDQWNRQFAESQNQNAFNNNLSLAQFNEGVNQNAFNNNLSLAQFNEGVNQNAFNNNLAWQQYLTGNQQWQQEFAANQNQNQFNNNLALANFQETHNQNQFNNDLNQLQYNHLYGGQSGSGGSSGGATNNTNNNNQNNTNTSGMTYEQLLALLTAGVGNPVSGVSGALGRRR